MIKKLDPYLPAIKAAEGFRAHPYKCSAGYWTIGYGWNLESLPVPEFLATRPLIPLAEEDASTLLKLHLDEFNKELCKALPWVGKLSEVRHAVLLEMGYNLGVPGLLKFKITLANIRDREYQIAAQAMLSSRWAGQVGQRAQRLSRSMSSGIWH